MTVTGRLVNAHGAFLASVVFSVSALDARGNILRSSPFTTDSSGNFSIVLGVGKHRLTYMDVLIDFSVPSSTETVHISELKA